MALRMITDKVMGLMAKQYQAALGNQLATYGKFCALIHRKRRWTVGSGVIWRRGVREAGRETGNGWPRLMKMSRFYS